MKAVNIFCLLLIFVFPLRIIMPQTDSLEFLPDETGFSFDKDERTDYSQFPEMIEELKSNPVDINSAELFELLNIPFIDPRTAHTILNYRSVYGRIFSLSELYSINGLNNEVIRRIIPFVTAIKEESKHNKDKPLTADNREPENKPVGFSFRSRLVASSLASNAEEGKYPGSPQKLYNRLIYSGSNFRAGLLIEKDAGETNLNDFTSFYLNFKKFGFIDKIVIGDYLFEFGQGLALYGPFGGNKSSELFSFSKSDRGLIPYSSSEENRFFRGSAAEFDLSFMKLSAFYSSGRFDAGREDSTGFISSMPLTGYHRSDSEIKNEDAGYERCYGGRIDVMADSLAELGLLIYNSEFSPSLALTAINRKAISQFTMYSLSYKVYLNDMYLTGEAARSMEKTSFIGIIQKDLSERFTLLLSLRSYSEGFPYIHSNAFGENSGRAENEAGLFIGCTYSSSFGRFSFYHDRFNPSVNKISASKGNETSLSFQRSFSSDFEIRCRFKNKSVQDVSGALKASEIVTNYLNLQAGYPALNGIGLMTRINFSHLSLTETGSNETGFGLSQELKYRNEFTQVNARVTYFRTNSYNSRIYEYEYDLPGVLNRSILYGEGVKWFLMVKHEAWNLMTFSIKYSQVSAMRKDNSISAEDGVVDIENNVLSLQLDLKL